MFYIGKTSGYTSLKDLNHFYFSSAIVDLEEFKIVLIIVKTFGDCRKSHPHEPAGCRLGYESDFTS